MRKLGDLLLNLFANKKFRLLFPVAGMFGAVFFGVWVAGVCGVFWVFAIAVTWDA